MLPRESFAKVQSEVSGPLKVPWDTWSATIACYVNIETCTRR